MTFPLLIFFPQIFICIVNGKFFYCSFFFHFHKDLTSKQVRITLILHAQVGDFIVKDNCFKNDAITFFENQLLEYSIISHLPKFKFTED